MTADTPDTHPSAAEAIDRARAFADAFAAYSAEPGTMLLDRQRARLLGGPTPDAPNDVISNMGAGATLTLADLKTLIRLAQGAAADAPTMNEWWTVDHTTSDPLTHAYCGACRAQIPGFLTKSERQLPPPYLIGGEPACCEGCGKTADADPDRGE